MVFQHSLIVVSDGPGEGVLRTDEIDLVKAILHEALDRAFDHADDELRNLIPHVAFDIGTASRTGEVIT